MGAVPVGSAIREGIVIYDNLVQVYGCRGVLDMDSIVLIVQVKREPCDTEHDIRIVSNARW